MQNNQNQKNKKKKKEDLEKNKKLRQTMMLKLLLLYLKQMPMQQRLQDLKKSWRNSNCLLNLKKQKNYTEMLKFLIKEVKIFVHIYRYSLHAQILLLTVQMMLLMLLVLMLLLFQFILMVKSNKKVTFQFGYQLQEVSESLLDQLLGDIKLSKEWEKK